MVKQILIKKFYLIYFSVNITVKLVVSLINVILWSIIYKIKFNKRPYDLYKYSHNKTIYILGTGDSINQYTQNEWSRIKQGYTIGLNMWVLHDFIPDILQLELYSDDENYLQNLIKIFKLRQNDFLHTKIIFKSNYLFMWKYKNLGYFFSELPKSLKKNIYFTIDFRIPGFDIQQFTKSINLLEKLNFFNFNSKYFLIVGQARASLGLSVVLAIQSGFKHISLCGVDLNNRNNFYDNSIYYQEKFGLKLENTNKDETVHLTNDLRFSELTISRALKVIESEICQKNEIKITVGSDKSALYPFFPLSF